MSKYGTMMAALALAGMTVALSGTEGRAQTAKNLDCDKCVETKDIGKKAVTRSRIKKNAVTGKKIKDGTVSPSKLSFDPATRSELDALQAEVDGLSQGQGDVLNLILPKAVFVTSGEFTGNLGGPAGGDALCQAAADDPLAVVPEGTYVAWLSTDTVDARDRITQTLGPYLRPDGAVFAKSFADLISSDFVNPVALDEFGDPRATTVWTGTRGTGKADPSHCAGWTSGLAGDIARVGSSNGTGAAWTAGPVLLDCDNAFAIYCFQK